MVRHSQPRKINHPLPLSYHYYTSIMSRRTDWTPTIPELVDVRLARLTRTQRPLPTSSPRTARAQAAAERASSSSRDSLASSPIPPVVTVPAEAKQELAEASLRDQFDIPEDEAEIAHPGPQETLTTRTRTSPPATSVAHTLAALPKSEPTTPRRVHLPIHIGNRLLELAQSTSAIYRVVDRARCQLGGTGVVTSALFSENGVFSILSRWGAELAIVETARVVLFTADADDGLGRLLEDCLERGGAIVLLDSSDLVANTALWHKCMSEMVQTMTVGKDAVLVVVQTHSGSKHDTTTAAPLVALFHSRKVVELPEVVRSVSTNLSTPWGQYARPASRARMLASLASVYPHSPEVRNAVLALDDLRKGRPLENETAITGGVDKSVTLERLVPLSPGAVKLARPLGVVDPLSAMVVDRMVRCGYGLAPGAENDIENRVTAAILSGGLVHKNVGSGVDVISNVLRRRGVHSVSTALLVHARGEVRVLDYSCTSPDEMTDRQLQRYLEVVAGATPIRMSLVVTQDVFEGDLTGDLLVSTAQGS